jgi:hypothetical protein
MRIRPSTARPSRKNRTSSLECCESGPSRASVSRNTVTASSNETPCFAALASAFRGSHSNTYLVYTKCRGPGASRDFDASKHISKKSWRRRYDSLRLAAEEARQATVAAVAATADALSANLAQMQFLEDARNTLRQLKGRKPGDIH